MPVAAHERVRCERSLERLQGVRDEALAEATIPLDRNTAQWVSAGDVKPAVDPKLWLDHVRFARHRDRVALEKLVAHYRAHAQAEARRHYRHGEPLEDLTQVALEALLLALQRFDPNRRRPFLAFAKPTVSGMIRRHFRDTGWSIRVPRRTHEMAGPIRDARDILTQDLGREPSKAEIADFMDVEENEVLSVLDAEDARRPNSLNAVDPNSQRQAEQVIGRPDAGLASVENRTALHQSLETMPDDDKELLRLYFLEGHTQSEVAEKLDCSQMQVSRLLARAIRRLRHDIVGD